MRELILLTAAYGYAVRLVALYGVWFNLSPTPEGLWFLYALSCVGFGAVIADEASLHVAPFPCAVLTLVASAGMFLLDLVVISLVRWGVS